MLTLTRLTATAITGIALTMAIGSPAQAQHTEEVMVAVPSAACVGAAKSLGYFWADMDERYGDGWQRPDLGAHDRLQYDRIYSQYSAACGHAAPARP